ncbi:ice-binding family protein [Flavobacterium sp.]|uniref:ice-binding family protein n=1 Tax=Flavobacterium sp. TaxID=239 RepID=UPI0038FC1D51
MKKNLLYSVIAIALLSFPNTSFGQTPNGTANLGILTSFECYTGAGGVANGAGGTVNGDVGTHLGIISGFISPPYTGNTYNANAATDQARKDLLRLYIHLNDKFVDFPGTSGPAFVGTLTPGVYSTDGAGSIGAALTLDGGGDPNAFFIIKFNGALTVGAGAVVTLTGGTQSCNVFYIANGAISIAAGANIKGNLFSKVGAVGLGANVILEGRMLTMAGAITIGVDAVASPPPGICTIPIFCESDCSPALSVDVLGVLSNFALYTSLGAIANTGISGMNGDIGTDGGAISGYTNGVHIGTEQTANALTAQAAIDLDIAYTALMALPNTVTSHAAAFGIGETINAGVYFVNGAGSLSGTITLDAQNNPNSIFVFKFAGAFNVAALSKIILANGARRCNVFWIGGAGVATGAVNIGAASIMKGTFLSHGGACNSGAGVFLSGRQFSTSGAVNTDTCVIYTNPECVTSTPLGLPVIAAVTDSPSVLPGTNTPSVIGNDTLNGVQAVIGTAPGQVTLTSTPNGPLTMNLATGTIAVAANTPAGTYPITYKICEVSSPTNCSTVTSNVTVTASAEAGTLDCAKTQIIQAPVQGVPNQVTLVVTMNVTTAGNFPVTLSGSGMSLANGITHVTTTTTGVQTFNIPMNYDGTTLSTLTFTVGSNTCTADLSLTKKKALIDVWTLDNCTIKIAAPTLN